ncbi:hypothetical protein ACHAW5_000712 [Stephanodiscus triporus]|uniref:Uncharacterized protein n=1 Tax=Stephanodiscus triporus TaxID=2934178 RepID=A0ABD3PT35_9STRA
MVSEAENGSVEEEVVGPRAVFIVEPGNDTPSRGKRRMAPIRTRISTTMMMARIAVASLALLTARHAMMLLLPLGRIGGHSESLHSGHRGGPQTPHNGASSRPMPARKAGPNNSDGRGGRRTANSSIPSAPPRCAECKFLHVHRDPRGTPVVGSSPPMLIRMTNEAVAGFGRTGNIVTSAFLAMKLAYICKSTLELPIADVRGGAMRRSRGGRLFDFARRRGRASARLPCGRAFVGNYADFWHLSSAHMSGWYGPGCSSGLSGEGWCIDDATDVPMDARVENELWACMRQYLGYCDEGVCEGHRSARDGVLVVHLRQGDIYEPNYSGNVHRAYQQPFLSYYYSIINFTRPERVIFVGEGLNHGPVWDAFEDLQSFGMTKYAIEFQSLSLEEDLLTMLCARQLVESRSTLNLALRLGYAVRRFSFACISAFPDAQQVYLVDTGKFDGGQHVNSAEEWVATLLRGKASLPRLCTAEDFEAASLLPGGSLAWMFSAQQGTRQREASSGN